jgi:hypothetical protein
MRQPKLLTNYLRASSVLAQQAKQRDRNEAKQRDWRERHNRLIDAIRKASRAFLAAGGFSKKWFRKWAQAFEDLGTVIKEDRWRAALDKVQLGPPSKNLLIELLKWSADGATVEQIEEYLSEHFAPKAPALPIQDWLSDSLCAEIQAALLKSGGCACSPITIDGGRVFVMGRLVCLDLNGKQRKDSLHFLTQLVQNLGQRMSGPDISQAGTHYKKKHRWDLLLKHLPDNLKDHIESNNRGYRIRPVE